uniref:Uncharacterized protein n=1 Tax=Anopheles arabiensis TaxID=7173 RepID=A0A182IGS5_ANOAR
MQSPDRCRVFGMCNKSCHRSDRQCVLCSCLLLATRPLTFEFSCTASCSVELDRKSDDGVGKR